MAYLREKDHAKRLLKDSSAKVKLTGHIHLGYLDSDPEKNRDLMLSTIEKSITNALNNF